MYRSAKLSDDLMCRWALERIWHHPFQRICVFILLNPSTATDDIDDPTILRCIAFAKYWGYDGIRIVNLVGFRATKPEVMFAWFVQQSSTHLYEHSLIAMDACLQPDVAKVIVGHGVLPKFMQWHATLTLQLVQHHRNLNAIKMNKDGSPAHPLYLRGDLKPSLYFV